MPVFRTAKLHFDDDIRRAEAIRTFGRTAPNDEVKFDCFRSSLMFGVGAADAFFSDAYADLISRTLQAKDIQADVDLPDRLQNLKLPVIAILRDRADGWRWRMAARELIEDETVLSVSKVKKLFNHFCATSRKICAADTIGDWIDGPHSRQRLFGITRQNYRALAPNLVGTQKTKSVKKFENRMNTIFQRRHDCIHNCDRPKQAVQGISRTFVEKATLDLVFFVERFDEHLREEYPKYLRNLGFSGATRARVLQ